MIQRSIVGSILAVFLLSSVGVTALSAQASANVVPRLGLVPRTCSVGPAPTVLGPVFGVGSAVSGYGAFPVWGMAFDGAHATLWWSRLPATRTRASCPHTVGGTRCCGS